MHNKVDKEKEKKKKESKLLKLNLIFIISKSAIHLLGEQNKIAI